MSFFLVLDQSAGVVDVHIVEEQICEDERSQALSLGPAHATVDLLIEA